MNGVLSIGSGAGAIITSFVSPKTVLRLDIAGWYVFKEACKAEKTWTSFKLKVTAPFQS
jgi:hypothetical protein